MAMKSEPEKQKRSNTILSYLKFYIPFFLDQYVTYCCLILGPATMGQYLDLRISVFDTAWNSEENYIYIYIYIYIYTVMSTKYADK